MARYSIANIEFHVSAVSIMQCWVGIGWSARGSAEDIDEFRRFTRHFFPFLIAQDCEQPIDQFCSSAVSRMEQVFAEENLKTDFLKRFADRLRGRLSRDNQRTVTNYAEKYDQKVQEWLGSPIGQCGRRAVELLSEWGLRPPYRSLAAIGAFGSAVFGKYVNDLKAVCVQLDVIARSEPPAIQFLETLLHEEIHAAIHERMGDDDGRPELTWLNELCAVLTSQEALLLAAKEGSDPAEIAQLNDALHRIRSNQQYGELAEAVLRDTGDPLVAAKAWRRIFDLDDEQRRNYARDRIITPMLNTLGWRVSFPYHYGKKYVTVFV